MKKIYIFILSLAFLAYAGAWYYGAAHVEKAFLRLIKEIEKQEDYSVEYDQISKGGFPFAMEVTLKNLKVKGNKASVNAPAQFSSIFISHQGDLKIRTSLFEPTYYISTQGTTTVSIYPQKVESNEQTNNVTFGPTTIALKLNEDQHLARFFKGKLLDYKEYKDLKELRIENNGTVFNYSSLHDKGKWSLASIDLILKKAAQKESESSWTFSYEGKDLVAKSERGPIEQSQNPFVDELILIFAPIIPSQTSDSSTNQMKIKGSLELYENPYLEDLYLSYLPCGKLTVDTFSSTSAYSKSDYTFDIKAGFGESNKNYYVGFKGKGNVNYSKELTKLFESVLDPTRLNSLKLETGAQLARQKMLEKPDIFRSFIPDFGAFEKLQENDDIKLVVDVKGENKEVTLFINDFHLWTKNYGVKIDKTILTMSLEELFSMKSLPTGSLSLHIENYKPLVKDFSDYVALVINGISKLRNEKDEENMPSPVAFNTEFLEIISDHPKENKKDLEITLKRSSNPELIQVGTLTMQEVRDSYVQLATKHAELLLKSNTEQSPPVKAD